MEILVIALSIGAVRFSGQLAGAITGASVGVDPASGQDAPPDSPPPPSDINGVGETPAPIRPDNPTIISAPSDTDVNLFVSRGSRNQA